MPTVREIAAENQAAQTANPPIVVTLQVLGWLSIALSATTLAFAIADHEHAPDVVFLVGSSGIFSGVIFLAIARLILELRAIRRILLDNRAATLIPTPPA